MEWTDDGIVLGTRRHGETSAIVEVMTRDHGRHLGLVRGGGGTRLRPLLQPGNTVRVVWRARLDEHLGHYAVEPLHLHGASQLAAAHVVYGVTHLGALCRLLPERDPHPEVHDHLAAVLEHLDDPLTAGLEMVRFELQMLVELGVGLDLASLAATISYGPSASTTACRIPGECSSAAPAAPPPATSASCSTKHTRRWPVDWPTPRCRWSCWRWQRGQRGLPPRSGYALSHSIAL